MSAQKSIPFLFDGEENARVLGIEGVGLHLMGGV